MLFLAHLFDKRLSRVNIDKYSINFLVQRFLGSDEMISVESRGSQSLNIRQAKFGRDSRRGLHSRDRFIAGRAVRGSYIHKTYKEIEPMSNFLLLLHQTPTSFRKLSPEEIQKILGSYIAWRDGLVKRNKMRGGEKLTDDGGRHLRMQSGKVSVTDGPYSESQEVLGGFFMIEAANYDEAVAIAQTCPHLVDGKWIEIRQVDAIH
jgi:hypothetical protein